VRRVTTVHDIDGCRRVIVGVDGVEIVPTGLVGNVSDAEDHNLFLDDDSSSDVDDENCDNGTVADFSRGAEAVAIIPSLTEHVGNRDIDANSVPLSARVADVGDIDNVGVTRANDGDNKTVGVFRRESEAVEVDIGLPNVRDGNTDNEEDKDVLLSIDAEVAFDGVALCKCDGVATVLLGADNVEEGEAVLRRTSLHVAPAVADVDRDRRSCLVAVCDADGVWAVREIVSLVVDCVLKENALAV
jgi:hypothetical protein